MKKYVLAFGVLSLFLLSVIVVQGTEDTSWGKVKEQAKGTPGSAAKKSAPVVGTDIEGALRAVAEELEVMYQDQRPGIALHRAIWIAGPGAEEVGNEVFFNDRGNKQIPVQWVPGDPRREGRTNITYLVIPSAPTGLSVGDVTGAIDDAMSTWNSQRCSRGLDVVPVSAGESFDILHLPFGFIPLPAGVLGLTVSFFFIDGSGPTDIDNDGAFDYAFAAILYAGSPGSGFTWAIDGNVDVETVALHEAGHGLGQGHFGKLFRTLKNGKFHFAPRAVMNAEYTGVQQSPAGTDGAGHCGIFGSWPNN